MATRSITKILTSPSKVANALDWKKVSGSLLSITVLKDKMELAVSSHPSFSEPLMSLPSIPLKMGTSDDKKKKVLNKCVVDELSGIVQDFSVCGMVVSWPVQKEGWCGAPCGRVLHILDQLTEQSKTLMHPNRPVCLWDEGHHSPPEDEWGRAPVYSKTTDKTLHTASQEQYGDHSTVAADAWNDFCHTHWPELYRQQPVSTGSKQRFWEGKKEESSSSDLSWLNSAEGRSLNQVLL